VNEKIVKHSDLTLTEGDPTERAAVHIQLEKIGLKGKLPGGNAFELKGSALPGSPQNTAITTFLLLIAGCLVAGTASWIGVPAITALITGLCAPVVTFALVRAISGRWAR
jgi:hypothetical protein